MSFWSSLFSAIFRATQSREPDRVPTDEAPRPTPTPSEPPFAPPPEPVPPAPEPAPAMPAPPSPPDLQPPQADGPSPMASRRVTKVIRLGCVDADVADADCQVFVSALEEITRVPLAQVADGLDKWRMDRRPPADDGAMTVSQVQQALRQLGFFPGGEVDGICGYRTQAAIRLFQEYVRTMDGHPDVIPDGIYGPQTHGHLVRWLQGGHRANWSPRPGEYDMWLGFLREVQASYVHAPGRVTEEVNQFAQASDTRRPAEWVTDGPGHIHLIGVRRTEFSGKFDDIFILLIKGLVFKFQGSTEPGSSSNPLGPPYLVPGQHDYHFGWHRRTYLALRPRSAGTLIIRAGDDRRLTEDDLQRGLEANPTINIHWGGRGMSRDVNSWSEGCQVINGEVYINPAGQLVSCGRFAAIFSSDPTRSASKTRGAYTLISDLVTALSGDMSGNTVHYTMVREADLDLVPAIRQSLDKARDRVFDIAI